MSKTTANGRSKKQILLVVFAFVIIQFFVIMTVWNIANRRPEQVTVRDRITHLNEEKLDPNDFNLLPTVDNAESVEVFSGTQNKISISYLVQENYPAPNTLQQISTELGKAGWNVLEHDWLNPQHNSSQITGWDSYYIADGSRNRVHVWTGQWQNEKGDVASFTLTYYPIEENSNRRKLLTVSGSYYPSETVEAMKSESSLIMKEFELQLDADNRE